MADETLKSLKKENEEMKQELDDIDQNRKANNFLSSTIFALFIACMFGIVILLAYFGAVSLIKELAMSERAAALLICFVNIAKWIGFLYIGWHWLTVVVMNFHEELIQAGKEIKIYVQAGRKALAEINTGKPKKTEARDGQKEPKKPAKPRKKPAHGKDGKFAKKPKPSATPPPA